MVDNNTDTRSPPVFSIPLISLPLRPSTLTALLRAGFSSSGAVMDACRQTTPGANENEASTEEDGNDRVGEPQSTRVEQVIRNSLINAAARVSLSPSASTVPHSTRTNDNPAAPYYAEFANDLGCSPSQAADYVHEIDDALVSLGLPKVSPPMEESSTTAANENTSTEYNDSTVAPHATRMPATAASLLQSSSSNHHGQMLKTYHIVSFSQTIDTLLGGGFALSELTEIVGLPGVGKTQLAMQLCVDARLPVSYGGVEGCAVVIDAEGSWSGASGGDRLWSMATAMVDHVKTSAEKRKNRLKEGAVSATHASNNSNEEGVNLDLPSWLTPESVLEGIHIFRVHDESSQTCTLYNLPTFLLDLEQKGTPARILVIDSIAFHYRVASSANSFSTTSNNNGKNKSNSLSNTHNLTRMATFLIELADQFEIAVVVMNHLTTRLEKGDANNQGGGMKLVPALGESWAHAITSRLMIDHYRHDPTSPIIVAPGELRTCTLIKSPHKPCGTALFTITDKGVRGVPPPNTQAQAAAKRTKLT